MKRQRLIMAETALRAIGDVQLGGALYFCWIGGREGISVPWRRYPLPVQRGRLFRLKAPHSTT